MFMRDQGHGSIETRQIRTIAELNDYFDFLQVQQVFAVRRKVFYLKENKTSEKTVYGVSGLNSQRADPIRILTLNR
jgi:hypothetical protein